MPKDDSARLVWVESFLALIAYDGASEAAKYIKPSTSTIVRHVDALQAWLHKVLYFDDNMSLTDDGDDFVIVAAEIVRLMEKGGLRAEVGITRVLPNGTVTIEGEPLGGDEAKRIGSLLAGARAELKPIDLEPAPRVDPRTIKIRSK